MIAGVKSARMCEIPTNTKMTRSHCHSLI